MWYSKREEKLIRKDSDRKPNVYQSNNTIEHSDETIRQSKSFYCDNRPNNQLVAFQNDNMQTVPNHQIPMNMSQNYQIQPYNSHQNVMGYNSQMHCYNPGVESRGMNHDMNHYQSQLPPLNRLSMEFNFPIMQNPNGITTNEMTMQNNDMQSNIGFNPFAPNHYRMQNLTAGNFGNTPVYIAARPLKVMPMMQQNGNMPASIISGDNKFILKATPLQQVIQIPLSMLTQNGYANANGFKFIHDQYR